MLDFHPDYDFCKDLGCREVSLGIQKMPDGYALFLNADQSHYFWFNKFTGVESDIHWSKWAVYRGAKRHSSTFKSKEPEDG